MGPPRAKDPPEGRHEVCRRPSPLRRPGVSPRDTAEDAIIGINVTEIARSAINAMNKFYNYTDGRWSYSEAWWLSGNALQVSLDYRYKTGQWENISYVERTFERQRRTLPWWPDGEGDFRADSTDDTGWWALAMLRFYDVTHDEKYLNVAKEDEAYIYNYWSDKCNGGVIWDIITESYKNAISNELYMALAIGLHNRAPGDGQYLAKAKAAWNWFEASGMINKQGLINDGLAEVKNSTNGTTCKNNGDTVWTYNQGVVLGALVGLYRATGDMRYLDKARAIANAVVESKALSPGGILTESCEANSSCDGNQDMFKGIFCRNLDELNAALEDDPYRIYLIKNALTMWNNARNASDFYDAGWAQQFNSSSLAKQASAASLLVALIRPS
ncbi:family 76 glycoside hydrolase [Thozetella sp. PMI_491]|nr:family 76 glycoside hydrolase [Thozetella sp. PMI_491]